MGKLVQISFSRELKDSEFVTMCDDLVGIFNDVEHNIECEIYAEALERFKLEVNIMHSIMPRERKHALTDEIFETHELRQDAIRGLIYAAKSASLSTDIKKRKEARSFMAWFSKYRRNLVNAAQDVVTRTVQQMSEDISKDADLGAIIVAIGVSAQLSELISIGNDIKSLRHERSVDRSGRKQSYVDNNAIRNDVSITLKMLLEQVERLIMWNGQEIASHLELGLFDVLDRARALSKRKRTINANKRAGKPEGEKPLPSNSNPNPGIKGVNGEKEEEKKGEEKESQNSSSNENTHPNNSSNPTSLEEKDEKESSEAV